MDIQLRAVIGARVSVFDKNTGVSHNEQTRVCQSWADAKGYPVVGSFEDLGVSAGKYTPWQRPGLGEWLKQEKLHEWDVLVFAKMDRAFRSTRDCVDLARFAEKHKKIIVFADDGLVLNYRNPKPGLDQMMAELFVYLGAFFAQLEWNRYQQRSLDGHRGVRFTARFSGRRPFGFQIVPAPDGKGKVLDYHPVEHPVLVRAGQRIINGDSFTAVADELGWSTTNLKNVLTRLSTQGYKLHRGQLVLSPETNQPIRFGPPAFDDVTWQELQAAIRLREYQGKRRAHSQNPLIGLGFCACPGCDNCTGPCGRQLIQRVFTKRGKTYRYAACHECRGVSRIMDEVTAILDESFLDDYGDEEVTTKVFVPGTDNTIELEQIKKSITRLRAESDSGLIDDENEYIARLQSLVERRKVLEASPVEPPGWKHQGLGVTFWELWSNPDTDKTKVLTDSGYRIELSPAPKPLPASIHIYSPKTA